MVGARGGRPEERHATDAAAPGCTADALSIRELGGRDEILTLVERAAGIGVWDVDLTTGLLRGTAQFFRIMGLQPTSVAVPIETTRRLRHPNDRERMAEGFRQAVASDVDYFEVEYRITRPDGEMRWIFGRGRVTRDAASVPTRYSGVDIDITDRKRAEAALQDSERRLRELNERLARQADERASQLASSRAQLQAFFDNSVDWLTLQRATPDGRFVYEDLNPTCASAYGIPREQVIGRTPEDVLGTEATWRAVHWRDERARSM
jgi:PAS domain S-box-containing protein